VVAVAVHHHVAQGRRVWCHSIGPLTATTTKLIYTLFFDNSMLPNAPARDRDIAQKTTMFTTALKNMKTLAKGGKLPPRGTTKPGDP
jgi:hypothetical protein